jgi:plastocyanin
VAIGVATLLAGCATAGAGGPVPVTSPASTVTGPGDVQLAAQDLAFDRSTVVVPAGRPFTLVFENRDWTPHNVSIAGPGGLMRFSGEIFGGVATRRYQVPALEAGRYTFRCDVHTGMSGDLVATP